MADNSPVLDALKLYRENEQHSYKRGAFVCMCVCILYCEHYLQSFIVLNRVGFVHRRSSLSPPTYAVMISAKSLLSSCFLCLLLLYLLLLQVYHCSPLCFGMFHAARLHSGCLIGNR